MAKATENTKATVFTIPVNWSVQTNALDKAVKGITVVSTDSTIGYSSMLAECGDSVTSKTVDRALMFTRQCYEKAEKSSTDFLIALTYSVSMIDKIEGVKDTKSLICAAIPNLHDSYSNYLKAVKALRAYGTNAEVIKYLASFGVTRLIGLYTDKEPAKVLTALQNGTLTPDMTVSTLRDKVSEITGKKAEAEAAKKKAEAEKAAKAEAAKKAEAEAAKSPDAKAKAEAEKAEKAAKKAEAEAAKKKIEAEKAAKAAKAEAEAAEKAKADAEAETELLKNASFEKVLVFISHLEYSDMLGTIIQKATERKAIVDKK